MDLDKSIRTAVDSGQVVMGTEKSVKIALNGKAKIVVVSSNCPENTVQDLRRYCDLSSIPLLSYTGTSLELGTVCGKPFPVSVLSVVEVGTSDILKAVEKG